MKNRRIVRSAASVILSLTLLFTSVIPETLLVNTVYAKETDNTVTILPGTDEAGTGTGKMSITLKVKKKIEPVVALDGWNYGGIPNSPKITSGNPGNGTVTYYYKVKGADDSTYSETIPTAQGNYTVKADIAETEEYYRGSATADFTIGSQTMSMKITLNIHKHNFTYESDGAKITAVCSADGCELEDKTVSLTLKAPARKIDTDNDSAEATIEGLEEFNAKTGLDVNTAQIEYFSGSTKLDEAPITKGNYTAKLTVGEENNKATATVDYSIGTSTQTHGMTITLVIKGDSTITKTPTAKELTYSGLAQELVVAGETEDGEMYYALGENATAAPDFDGTSEASDKKWNTSIPKATDVGTYYVWYKVVGDATHNDSDESCVTVTIAKKTVTVTFKVVNGSWDDETTADKTVTLTGYEGDTLKLAAEDIPAVGSKANNGYMAGSWDVTPSTETEITNAITYTYIYVQEEEEAHTHDIVFTADGATVTGTCTNEGCTLDDVTLTIAAPTLTTVGGTGSEKATLTQTGLTMDFLEAYINNVSEDMTVEKAMDIFEASIMYEGTGDTTYEKSNDAPTKAGTYQASFTIAEGAAAVVEYEIKPSDAAKTEGKVTFNQEEGSEAPVETSIKNAESSNINEVAKNFVDPEKDVKIELEITPKKEADVVSAPMIDEAAKEAFAGIEPEKIEKEYLEIDISKYVDDIKSEGKITDTNTPIEIALAYDNSKVKNPIVIRTHGEEVQVFERLSEKPAKDFKDGTYYVDAENGVIYVYSQYFSDFAIVYTTETIYNVGFVSDTDNNPASLKVAEGGKITLPTGLTKDGFAFDGWYKDSEYKAAWNVDNDTVNSDITLYAKWNRSVTGVNVTPAEVKFTKAGDTKQIETVVTPADAANTKVSYKSSDIKVATVDTNGKIKAVANGTATITVTTEDGAKTATVKVTVAISEPQKQGTPEKPKPDQPEAEQPKTEQPKTEQPVTEQQKTEKTATKQTKEKITKVDKKTYEKNSLSINAGLEVKQVGKKIKIKWGKVNGAKGYFVYVQYCGKSYSSKATKTINGASKTSATVKKVNGKKLDLKKNFKVKVVAYSNIKAGKKLLGNSIPAHVVGVKNKKYTNAKDIKITSHTIVNVYKGIDHKITAKTILVDKSKKQLSDAHAKEFRYTSSDESIAKVSKDGVISAVKSGKCTIYVYARNGYTKEIKVTVP